MPKIVISEIDNTTPGVLDEDFDVVYIPGFVDTTQPELKTKDGEYVGLQYRTPTLFTSLSAFISLCGSKPAQFKTAQDYRSLNTGNTVGFADDAVPFDCLMFDENDYDPAYTMAKELLAAGLNVLYERVNPDSNIESSVPVTETVTNPAEKTYYITTGICDRIRGGVAPDLYKHFDKETKVVDDGEYYTLNTSVTPATYVDISSEDLQKSADPEDTTYGKYGIKLVDNECYITPSSNVFYRAKYFSVSEITDCTGSEEVDVYVRNEAGKIESKKLYLINKLPENWGTTYYLDYYEETEEEVLADDFVVEGKTLAQVLNTLISDASVKVVKCADTINIKTMYSELTDIFSITRDGLADKGNYNFKYLTSGGYPVYEYNKGDLVTKMLNLANERGDCVALIDHTDNPYRETNIDLSGSLYNAVSSDTLFDKSGDFGTMFTPWAVYNRITSDYNSVKDAEGNLKKTIITDNVNIRFPASFAYLAALADSIKTNASWLAVAGSARGSVLNLASGGMTMNIPNGAADEMQPREGIAVNAITDIKPYGYTIWGNRTLKVNEDNLVATSFLNIRNLVSDVKKVCYRTARKLTFEQNNDILWINFKAGIAPTLDRMVTGYGLSGYKLVRDYEHKKAAEKATLCAKIYLYPVYPVEDFYVTIILQDDEVSVQ